MDFAERLQLVPLHMIISLMHQVIRVKDFICKVRSQKRFTSQVPRALTFQSLVKWLQKIVKESRDNDFYEWGSALYSLTVQSNLMATSASCQSNGHRHRIGA
jgi:hypothetical protein